MSSDSFHNGSERPRLHPARSFIRMESSGVSPFVRSRSKTMQDLTISEHVDSDALPLPLSEDDQQSATNPDVFEKSDPMDAGFGDEGHLGEEASFLSRNWQDDPVELPIELISLTDRFVNSLSAKVHSSPPTINKISHLFQEFYSRADSHIATHISALASRINRDHSPHSPSEGARGSAQTKSNHKARQMLTASEVAEKRKARKFLGYKRVALEEAVEKRACESIYDKIWRHKSTLDEVRDEKLRSKTAALSLVGINLKDLGVDMDLATVDEEKQRQADDCLSVARECLMKMNDEKFPLGKLQHLAAAHKAIVDALTNLLPSSSSADEILPTLIYSLINCPPDGINIISNLLFIQRFRSSSKMDGETAYCLTNLEAAVTFLENVDLSSLRADEVQDGQPKAPSETSIPSVEKADTLRLSKEIAIPSVSSVSASPELLKPDTKETLSATLSKGQTSPSPQQRRLSNLFQPPAKVLGAANDAVRNTADQSLKNIGATLDTSFNFLFGRLKELQINQGPGADSQHPVLPKTLAEARRLVTSSSTLDNKHQWPEEIVQESSTTDQISQRSTGSRAEDKFLGLVSGRRTPRDRSVDSIRTQGSSKRSIAASSLKDDPPSDSTLFAPSTSSSSTPTPLESMKNFGNTFNPLNLPGMIRNFGRAASDGPAAAASPSATERGKTPVGPADNVSNTSRPVSKIDPPIQRFLDTQNASDLKIGDVALLLQDYKRLAVALAKQGN